MTASPTVGDGALRRACFFHPLLLRDKESPLRKTWLVGNVAPAPNAGLRSAASVGFTAPSPARNRLFQD